MVATAAESKKASSLPLEPARVCPAFGSVTSLALALAIARTPPFFDRQRRRRQGRRRRRRRPGRLRACVTDRGWTQVHDSQSDTLWLFPSAAAATATSSSSFIVRSSSHEQRVGVSPSTHAHARTSYLFGMRSSRGSAFQSISRLVERSRGRNRRIIFVPSRRFASRPLRPASFFS